MSEEYEFDDFKPAVVEDGVNPSVKKAIEKEQTELESFKAENDDIILASEDPRKALTEMMVEYIQNVGDVSEVNYCSYNTGQGEAIDAWAYSGDEDLVSIDLFLTVLVDPEKGARLPKSEVERYFKWMQKFFERSQSGATLTKIQDKHSDLYQIAQLINDSDKVDRVRMFLMTNAITPSNLELDERETDEGTILEYHLWDVKRIKKHDDILRGKEAVVVDFEDTGFNPLPCIKMPDVSRRVDCYLAIIPGETLSKIYNQYHQHILEQNVRTFLQFKGASNKGIRDTLIGHKPTASQKAKGDKARPAEPDLFFSYNNGISTTATDIEIRETEQGPVIVKLTDWQIVNGGQTTASISAVMKMKDTDPDMIKQVFVAMKVSVIKKKEDKEDLVPRISQFANTQSAIKKSDFGINEPFLQELEQQSRLVWVKNSQNKEISKWFFERTRGQYMDKAKHTANAREEKEYYEEYPKRQMFDKSDLAKCYMAWEQEPHTVCWGGEQCYSAFYKRITTSRVNVDEQTFKSIIGKLLLFRTIDAYFGKDGINLAGYKANMIAYSMAVISNLTNKALDFISIWNEQSIITPSVYREIDGNMPLLYAKILAGSDVITYKIKEPTITSTGKKANKWIVKHLTSSDIQKIKETTLYRVMCLVLELKPYIWEHIMDVEEGTNIATYTKKVGCWNALKSKNLGGHIKVSSDILTSQEEFAITPSMQKKIDLANDYDYGIWLDLNRWGKNYGLLTPREIAFMGNIYYSVKRGKDLSYKQAKWALSILEKARAAGWEE
ncbi:MAG: AIPR family protein [Muribaculum sp.]|nr:AIPR family protein [Muribaculum sp.]